MRIEEEHRGHWASPYVEELADHSIVAILASATFLEAMVNELFTDAYDEHGLTGDGYLAPLDRRVVQLMAAWWTETDEGMDRPLAKYQLLLAFAGKSRLDSGSEPIQSAALLIKIRNAIAHYKPDTVYAEEPHRLIQACRGRFAPNGLRPDGSHAGWPNEMLGAGCAEWAHRSAQALADETCARLGITPNYQRALRLAQ
jgi:hypothetical protein